ncbi:LPD38 domain-containing protein [Pasteurella sp. PK-2025]|uniref:LPD3 domain-containing protein n=1 Tax=Pasteurella sp. PK-2025 TaxID=3413133 RepID=UPI003C714D56
MSAFKLTNNEYEYMQKTVFGGGRGKDNDDAAPISYLSETPKPEEQGFMGDVVDSFQMGVWRGASHLARGLGTVLDSDWLNKTADWAARGADENMATMSNKMRDALGQSALDGYDEKTGEGKGVLNAYWWAGNLGALLGEQLDTIATLGAGKLATVGVKAAGRYAAKKLSKEAAEQIGEVAVKEAAKRGIPPNLQRAMGVTAVMSAMSAGSRASQVYDEVGQMSNNDLANLEGFKQAYWGLKESPKGQNLTHEELFEQAKQSFRNQVGRTAALDPMAIATDIVSNSITGLGGGLWGLAKPGQTIKKGVMKGALLESGTEGWQSAAEQYAINRTAQQYYDPNRDIHEGVKQNVVDGMVLGSALGGVMGGIDAISHRNALNGQRKRVIEAINTGNPQIDAQLQRYANNINQWANDVDDLVINIQRANAMNQRASAVAEQMRTQQQAQTQPQAATSQPSFATEGETSEFIPPSVGEYVEPNTPDYSMSAFNPEWQPNVDVGVESSEANNADPAYKFSRSAMKSVEANIARGREAMTKAILEKSSVHRAMYRNDLDGWIDFEWGDKGRLLPNGKTKGAMGLAHIIDKRMAIDGMSEQEVTRFLIDDITETIAKGRIDRESVFDKTRTVQISYNGNEVRIAKKQGNNGWVVTGFKQHQPMNQSRGATTSDLRNLDPIRSRIEMGATGENTLLQTDEQGNSFKLSRSAPADYVRDLMVTHNISGDGILHAHKMGGLPYASVAVTKQDNPLTGFGEVTLIGDRNYIDPKGENKAKVFGADIYSPRYPKVTYEYNSKDVQHLREKFEQSAKEIDDSAFDYDFSQGLGDTGVLQALLKSDAVKHQFLKEQGISYETAYKTLEKDPDVDYPSVQRAIKQGVTAEQINDNVNLDKFEPLMRAFIQDRIERLKQSNSPPAKRTIARAEQALSGDKYDVMNFAKIPLMKALDNQENRQVVDNPATISNMRKAVEQHQDAFRAYVDEIAEGISAKENIRKGENRYGEATYMAHTLENVVKKLKKDLRGGEGYGYGFGNIRSKVTPKFKSVNDIQKNKHRLVSREDFEKVRNEIDNKATQLAQDLGVSDVNTFLWNVVDENADAAFRYANVENTPENRQKVADFLSKLEAMPTEYFEGKAKDVTQFSDFKGAVIPKSLTPQARAVLENAGLKLYEYDGEVDNHRAEMIKQATNELDALHNREILFSKSLQKPDRLEKLRKAKPIEITGNEIQPSDDLRQYKRNALAYGKSLRGAYTNKDTGKTVELGAGGVKEILQHDYKDVEHLQSIAAIPQIIENAIYIDTLPNEDKAKNFAIDGYEYYLAGLKIGGVDYTVRAVIGVTKDGNRYYDHKLTKIEKGELLSLPSRITNPVGESSSPLSDVNDKRLLQILQQQKANLAQTQAQIKKIVGNKLAEHFEVVNRKQIGIDDPTVEAGYNPKTGKIFIIEDNIRGNSVLSRDERLKWVAWHELAHRGVQVKFAHQYRNLMTKIEQNTTVRELADAIQQQREETRGNRLLAVEEALAELNAAYTTGKMEELKSRYGIKVPPMREKQLKSWLEITVQRIREFVARLFGKERAEQFSHDDLISLIKEVQGAMGGEIEGKADSKVKQSVDENQKHRSFNQTAEQYGGKQAYEQAKAQGRTELDYRQWVQVRTPEFKAWFGDWENDPENASKVINPRTGEPLIVYHGTNAEFNTFDKSKQNSTGQYGGGFYFTGDENISQLFGDNKMPVFLNAKISQKDKILARRKDIHLEYDHIRPDDSRDIWVVLKPNQIKSATDNTGAFDVGSDDIRYSSSENPTAEFAEAVPKRQAKSYDEARAIVSDLLGEPLINKETGMVATISRRSLDKLLSGKAVDKSTNLQDHLTAVANIDQLFENAIQGWVEPDKNNDPNIAGVHRLFAPLNIDGQIRLAKLTVKAMSFDQGNRIYSVETIEVENKNSDLSLSWKPQLSENTQLTSQQIANVQSLIQRIQKFNSNPNPAYKFSRSQSNVEKLRKINENTPLENMTDMAKAMANRPLSEWKSLMLEYGKRANTKIFDALAPIKYAEDKAGITDHTQSAYTAARLAAGSASISEASMLYGLPEYREGIIQRKQGTTEQDALFGILQSLGNDANDFLAWVAGNRADKLMQEGRENHFSQAEINELKALNKGKEAKFEQARQKLMAWNQSLLDLAESTGLINQEDRAKWEDKEFYIPFYRESEDGDAIAPYRNKGLSGQNAGIKRLKGSDKAVNDLLENVITNATKLIDASVKNAAMTKAVTNLADTGVITLIENPTYMDWKKLGSSKHGADKDGGVALVRIEGKEQMVRINDAMLFNAITSIDQKPLDYPFRKLFAGPKRVLTATVTSMPNFIVRNFLRDMAQAWVVDRNNGFKLGMDSIKGLKDAYKRTGSSIDLMFAGASFGAGYVNGGNPEEAAVHIRKHLRKQGRNVAEIDGFMDGVIFTKDKLSSVLDRYFYLNHAAENANRIAVYDRAIASGKSKAQAALESKDLMDFSMHGSATALRILGDVLPFFNARLQGMSQLGRAFKTNPRELAKRGAIIALASVALAAMNQGEEWYEEQGDDIKDNFWLANLGGQIIKIPKPFELGVVFGTIPERLYRTMSGADSTGRFKDRLLSAVTNTLALNPIPQAVKPIFEVYNNYDSFRGREIETLSDRRLMKEARYDERTSLVSRGMAGLTSTIGLSPKQTDHLIHGYFGTLGMYVLGMSDLAIRKADGYGELPAKNWQEYPVLDAVFGGDVAVPRKYTRYMNDYYNFLNQVSEISATVKSYKDDGRASDAKLLMEENKRLLAYKPALSQTQKQLKVVKAQMDMIQNNPNLTAEQKRQRLDRLRENKNNIVRMVVERMEKEDF